MFVLDDFECIVRDDAPQASGRSSWETCGAEWVRITDQNLPDHVTSRKIRECQTMLHKSRMQWRHAAPTGVKFTIQGSPDHITLHKKSDR